MNYINVPILLATSNENNNLLNWPTAFAVVCGLLLLFTFFSVIVTGKYPWDRN